MTAVQTSERRIRDIMTSHPVAVRRSDAARVVARVLVDQEISGVPVVDEQDRVVGVISRTDLLQRCLEGPLSSRPVSFFELIAEGLGRGTDLDPEELGVAEEFMSTDLVTVMPDDTLNVVARRLGEERYHRAIVVDSHRRLIGIVTVLDLLGAFPD